MGLQGGVRYFDGRPVDPALIDTMDRRLGRFDVGDSTRHVEPGVALVYRGVPVAAEDSLSQRLFTSRQGTVLTWDGRLDNREDLLLDLWRKVDDDATDVALAAAAHAEWGDIGLRRLIGDWSLVLWDPVAHTVKLASDYAGNRGLYYWEGPSQLHWSTSLAELVDRIGLSEHIDRRFIVGFLTAVSAPDLTPYVGVSSVSTGQVLTWLADGRKRRSRFWECTAGHVRYADPAEYASEFRLLFGQAVAGRLRARQPVWAELSGGLDSSAIVCMADFVLGAGTATAHRVETVSCVTESSPESDESPFIAAVEQHRHCAGHRVMSECFVDSCDEKWGWVSPFHPAGKALEMFRMAERNGSRVLLSGRMGDVVMANTPEDLGGLLEALDERRFAQFATRAHEWCRSCQKTAWHLAHRLSLEFLPRRTRVRASLLDVLGPFVVQGESVAEAAAEAFHLPRELADLWCEEATRRAARILNFECLSKRQLFADIVDSTELRWLLSPPELTPVTYSHPHSHRPLVEFMMAIPANVTCQPGKPRALMRNALAGILPNRILRRFSKGFADPLHIRTIKARMPADPSRMDTWLVVQRSYVDPGCLRRSLDLVRNGACRRLRNLQMIVNLERWLQQMDRRDARA